MKIFITGGTGLIGSALIDALLEKRYEVTVHTRNIAKALKKLGNKVGYNSSLDINGILDGYDAVINLAGASIAGGRWTKKRKELLCNSRLKITEKLAELIRNSTNPPSIFISGSAIGYYGAQKDNVVTEETTPHNEFTYRLCHRWESAAKEAQSSRTRVCLLRAGIVLSSAGGMLPKMALPFNLGLGSVLGNGNQFIPWIHIQDMVNGIVYLLENSHAQGPFNMTSPNPVTNSIFSKQLAQVLHRPCLFRIPSFIISGAMGEMSTLVLDGQRAVPDRLTGIGYRFLYEDIDEALQDIYRM